MMLSDFERESDENHKDVRLGVVGASRVLENSGKFPECYAPPGGTYWLEGA